MITRVVDSLVAAFSPRAAVSRMHARQVLRAYAAAEASRLNSQRRPQNRAADAELLGPWGADDVRKWARQLVRDNPWAWGIVDSIVANVVGSGITAQAMYETPAGGDLEGVNWTRDEVWEQWAEVCDYNGQYTFQELQRMVQREMIEAGEVIVRMLDTKDKVKDGIYRPVPLALELIEADRICLDRDTYLVRAGRVEAGNQVIRGVEMDRFGKPVAYWLYPANPNGPYGGYQLDPERIRAKDILHLFRRERVGQSRGVSWFAPALTAIRDLGTYIENELQASAVAACFGVAIKTEASFTGLPADSTEDSEDSRGSPYRFLEPGMVLELDPGDSVEPINPTRPNTGAAVFIETILRAVSAGMGLSYEVVARDYTKTNYSSARTSQLEDRKRYRVWQQYLVSHLCQPVYDRFMDAAARAGLEDFPSAGELLDARRKVAPVEWQTPEWEWVDPMSEQQASANSIRDLQSTYQAELGSTGRNWRAVFYQRAKEEALKRQLRLATADEAELENKLETTAIATAANAGENGQPAQPGTSENSALSRLQWGRNAKATQDVLDQVKAGQLTVAAANVYLQSLGWSAENADILVTDALTTSGQMEPEQEVATNG